MKCFRTMGTHLVGSGLSAHRATHYHQAVTHQQHLVYLQNFLQIPWRRLQIPIRQVDVQPLEYVATLRLSGINKI